MFVGVLGKKQQVSQKRHDELYDGESAVDGADEKSLDVDDEAFSKLPFLKALYPGIAARRIDGSVDFIVFRPSHRGDFEAEFLKSRLGGFPGFAEEPENLQENVVGNFFGNFRFGFEAPL